MLAKIAFYLSFYLFAIGMLITIIPRSYFTKLLGLGILQTGVLVFYVSLGKVFGAYPPVLDKAAHLYSNPVPHVLMLTAIVVGFSTMSIGLALVFKINKKPSSISEAIMIYEAGNE